MSVQNEANLRAKKQIDQIKGWLESPQSVDDYIKELNHSGKVLRNIALIVLLLSSLMGLIIVMGKIPVK